MMMNAVSGAEFSIEYLIERAEGFPDIYSDIRADYFKYGLLRCPRLTHI
jgi:hypothetical protein